MTKKVELCLGGIKGPRADALRALAAALAPAYDLRLVAGDGRRCEVDPNRSAWGRPDLVVTFDDAAPAASGTPGICDLSHLAFETADQTPAALAEARCCDARLLISSRRRDLALVGAAFDLRHAPLPLATLAGPLPSRGGAGLRLGVLTDLRDLGGDFAFACALARSEADVAILDLGADARERAMALAEIDVVVASAESPDAEAYLLEAAARDRFVITRSSRIADELADQDGDGTLAIASDAAALAAAVHWCRRNVDLVRQGARRHGAHVRQGRSVDAVAPVWAAIFAAALGRTSPLAPLRFADGFLGAGALSASTPVLEGAVSPTAAGRETARTAVAPGTQIAGPQPAPAPVAPPTRAPASETAAAVGLPGAGAPTPTTAGKEAASALPVLPPRLIAALRSRCTDSPWWLARDLPAPAGFVPASELDDLPEGCFAVVVAASPGTIDLVEHLAQRCAEVVLVDAGSARSAADVADVERRLLALGASFRDRVPLADGGCAWRLAFPAADRVPA